jgi:hypothetical protein
MFKPLQTCIACFVSLWDMTIGIVGLTISFLKVQETYIKFKVKYNKKETLHNITLLGEETSILTVDSKDEEKEEVWVKAEYRSSVIIAHNQDT